MLWWPLKHNVPWRRASRPSSVSGETLAEREAGQNRRGGQAPIGCCHSHQWSLHQRNRGGLRARVGNRHRQNRHPRAGAEVHALLRAQLAAATAASRAHCYCCTVAA
jgi:hypothetical protein